MSIPCEEGRENIDLIDFLIKHKVSQLFTNISLVIFSRKDCPPCIVWKREIEKSVGNHSAAEESLHTFKVKLIQETVTKIMNKIHIVTTLSKEDLKHRIYQVVKNQMDVNFLIIDAANFSINMDNNQDSIHTSIIKNSLFGAYRTVKSVPVFFKFLHCPSYSFTFSTSDEKLNSYLYPAGYEPEEFSIEDILLDKKTTGKHPITAAGLFYKEEDFDILDFLSKDFCHNFLTLLENR